VTKTIVVTGGSSGIGLTAVRRLAAAGHRVYSASRNPSRTDLPPGVTPLECDVGDPACADALQQVIAETGRLDALVNNAAIGELAALEEGSDEEARQVVEVNLLGPMRLVRAALPVMREQGGGHIVNVTSLNDSLASPFIGWYDATKAGLAAVSYALAAEVKHLGIRVTVIAPGLFRTEMAEALGAFVPPADSRYRRVLELLAASQGQRIDQAGDPDEVGAAIEEVINDDDPPIRVVVGADAKAMVAAGFDTNAYVPANAARIAAALAEPSAGPAPDGG
jgi:NAD(P)-dependent dehydrogenase (short-subunit alcohol dehydrogenase family)